MKYLIFIALSFLSGCTINVGQEMVYIYDDYPIYPIAKEPELQKITGNEIESWKELAIYTKEIYADGKITKEESDNYNKLLDKSKQNEDNLRNKIKLNTDILQRWGKKNQTTLEMYNKYAEEKNKE